MELKDYISILNRRKWSVISVLVVVVITVFIGTRMQTPIYESSVTLRVAASSTGQLDYSSGSYVSQLLNTTAQIATTGTLLTDLQSRLNLPKLPVVTSEVIPNTELIKLTVEDTDPQRAADTANMLAEIIISQSYYVYTGGAINALSVLGTQVATVEQKMLITRDQYTRSLQQTPASPDASDLLYQELILEQRNYDALLSQYQSQQVQNEMRSNMITIVEKPLVATQPSKPQMALNMILGVVAGAMAGGVLAFVVNSLDSRLYTSQEIEKYTGATTFARIPKVSKEQTKLTSFGGSAFSDSFRELAMKLIQGEGTKNSKVFLIFSAEPNQGKTMIVSHLAVALAECGKRTIAVDCDMRLPHLHKWFNLQNSIGLKDVVENNVDLNSAIIETGFDGLWVLPSGEIPLKPTLLLGSQAMKNLIATLAMRFDYVLLDTPALLAVGDVTVISESADSLIFIARRNETTREAAKSGGAFLKAFPEKFTALVVNQDSTGDGYYYHHNESEPQGLTSEYIVKRLQMEQKENVAETPGAKTRTRVHEADLDLERAVVQMALGQPLYGQIRVAKELRKRGFTVTPGIVRNLWLKNGLETFEKRNQAVSQSSTGKKEELSPEQLKSIEKARSDRESEAEIESHFPGELGIQDCIYVGRLDGVGRVYQQVFIDAFTNFGFVKLYYRKNIESATDLLNEKVLPFYRKEGLRLNAVLTDHSAIFEIEPEKNGYEKLLSDQSIDHRFTNAWHVKTNGLSLRFQKMLNDDFYQVMMRKKSYTSLGELQKDLDRWMSEFNYQKEFPGKYCYGRSPYQTLTDVKMSQQIDDSRQAQASPVERSLSL